MLGLLGLRSRLGRLLLLYLGLEKQIGGRHPRGAVEKPALLLFSGLLAHQGAVVHGNVDGSPCGLGCGSLLPHLLPAASAGGRLGLRLVVILRPVGDPAHYISHRAVEGGQAHHQAHQHKKDGGADGGKEGHKPLGDHAAQAAAGLQLHSAGHQRAPQLGVPRQGVHQQAVDQAGENQGQQQGAHQAQPHRSAPVEGQNIGPQQQCRGRKPEAVAQQALHQVTEPMDEDPLGIEIAKGGKDGQQKADHAPKLPAKGAAFGGGLAFSAAAFGTGGSRGPFSSGRGFGAAAPGFLLCGCHKLSILSGFRLRRREPGSSPSGSEQGTQLPRPSSSKQRRRTCPWRPAGSQGRWRNSPPLRR